MTLLLSTYFVVFIIDNEIVELYLLTDLGCAGCTLGVININYGIWGSGAVHLVARFQGAATHW